MSGRWSSTVEGGWHLYGILADELAQNTLQSVVSNNRRGETFVVVRRRCCQRQQQGQHEDRTTAAGGGMRSDDDGRQTIIGDRAFVMLEDADQYL